MSMSSSQQDQLDLTAVNNFRDYLRFPTVHPDVDYTDCVKWLQNQAKGLGLPCKTFEFHPKKPIVIITWEGTAPSETSVLLNSHMDVVPCFPDKWKYPPFDAHMDAKGDIYARGAQDMKCVGIMYMEAIRRLKLRGDRFKRTVHLSFVPDEETGGTLGMASFVKTPEFKALNVGFSLDEGVCSPEELYYFFNGERYIWHVAIKCPGNPGHGSLLLDNTPGEKLQIVLSRSYEFRQQQKLRLKDPNVQIGDVVTINLTQISGGVQTNVIPDEMTAVYDIRIPPSMLPEEVESILNSWCKEAGEGVHLEFEKKDPRIASTVLDDSNLFWLAFKKSCEEQGLAMKTGVFPGGTDSRYVRQIGIPAIGFTPANLTPTLLHDHNEFLNKDTFLNGIKIYMKLIPDVANC